MTELFIGIGMTLIENSFGLLTVLVSKNSELKLLTPILGDKRFHTRYF